MTCNIDGCGASGRMRRGMCNAHYFRWYRTGDPGPAEITDARRVVAPPTCTVDGCASPRAAHGMCEKHLGRVRKYGTTELPAEHPNYIGDRITYQGMHRRLGRRRGRAADHPCAECGNKARDWAYDHDDEQERSQVWRGKLVAYSTSVDHYDPLCRSCHTKRDRWTA